MRASLPLENSVFGPPTNLQITPNGRLALVADSVVNTRSADGAKWTASPTDKLHVVDLDATPPALLASITVGRQPSGLAINAQGTLALVANRAGKSVSVLTIDGTTVSQVAELPMGEEVCAVAITPDGKRGFAAKNNSAKVAVLSIAGTTVTTDKAQDVPVGLGVYNLDVTPDGKYLIAANTGTAGDGSSKTLTVVDAASDHPHAISTASVGGRPGGDGDLTRWQVGRGAAAARDDRVEDGLVLHQDRSCGADDGGTWRHLAAGVHGTARRRSRRGWPGARIAARSTSATMPIATMQIFHVQDGKLVETGTRIALPGQPASIRGLAR